MALAAALVRAAAPMLLRGREAPCSAPALHPRRLLSCSTTSDAPPPPARPLASKLAEPESQLPWREAQAEILRDIEPVVQLIKDILHSDRLIDTHSSGSQDASLLFARMAYGLISHTRSASVSTSEKSIHRMERDLYKNISSEPEGIISRGCVHGKKNCYHTYKV
ncbi:uncharacterized protein [Lolium perenne]|uniref:uncharacterized protein isoform X3 n=1 Tax=Lolium perenne TaxID=4522 RepID=UPI0021F51C19|nr:uncharacterized protein LOC127300944 isoform X2 [Lolium perenne]